MDNIPDLTERLLAPLASQDAGWSGDLAQLPRETGEALYIELNKGMTDAQAKKVVRSLDHVFGTAVEIAVSLCELREASDGGKRPRKLGVRLRNDIAGLRARLAGGDVTSYKVCSDILSYPILERMVTPLLEERLRCRTVDPLRNAPERAVDHLPDVLTRLHDAIRAGVTTGPVEPVQDFLAWSVVNSIECATGRIPGRTWIEERGEETGVGLEVCRIIAAALNDALPAQCKSERPADMAKAFRRAKNAANSGDYPSP